MPIDALPIADNPLLPFLPAEFLLLTPLFRLVNALILTAAIIVRNPARSACRIRGFGLPEEQGLASLFHLGS